MTFSLFPVFAYPVALTPGVARLVLCGSSWMSALTLWCEDMMGRFNLAGQLWS